MGRITLQLSQKGALEVLSNFKGGRHLRCVLIPPAFVAKGQKTIDLY